MKVGDIVYIKNGENPLKDEIRHIDYCQSDQITPKYIYLNVFQGINTSYERHELLSVKEYRNFQLELLGV